MILRTIGEAAAGPDYMGELFVILGIALTAVLGWVGTVIAKRFREPSRIETLWERLDELTLEVYGDDKRLGLRKRMEMSERRDLAKGRIIRDLARQWPGEESPRLNPSDLEELDEDTIPAHWRVKP